ncbi:hypothetical protein [Elioraea sp.]|uniref:hypothetical protein n=1 Tax=Elioraea sp. TaxID=2185103 RepID=UPI00307DBE5B
MKAFLFLTALAAAEPAAAQDKFYSHSTNVGNSKYEAMATAILANQTTQGASITYLSEIIPPSGEVKLGAGGACATENEGALRYNSTSGGVEFCNGTAWQPVGGGGALPQYSIVPMYTATPPIGFQVCDGTNGTPDLRGRFLVGVGSLSINGHAETYTLGQMGGAHRVTLNINQLPAHNHGMSHYITLVHTNPAYLKTTGSIWHIHGDTGTWDNASSPASSFTLGTDNAGGGQPFDNRPPFRAVVYMCKTL